MVKDTQGEAGATEGRGKRSRRDEPYALYQRSSDARWVGRLKLPGGRHRYFTGTTRREVLEGRDGRAGLRAALRVVQSGQPLPDERLTFGAYLERWLAGLSSPPLKPRTVEYYREYPRRYILGTELASRSLARLTTGDLRALCSARLEAGLAQTTVHHLHAVIRRALGVAHRDGVIPRNVAALLDKGEKPGMGRSPMRALQDEEPERFLEAVRGEPLEALFTLAITAGLRQGELLGLRWRDVDLERGVLSVTSSLQLGRDGTRVIGTTKTGRGRSVELAPITVTALREQRRRQREAQLRAGSRWQDSGLVFSNSFGDHIYPASLNRTLDRALAVAGLPRVRFHDLRHTAATRMLSRGVHPKIVSEMLGHASVGITLDLYSHVTPTMQREAVRTAWGEADGRTQ